jgi:hypothetical protein
LVEEAPMTKSLAAIADAITHNGFAFVQAPDMHAILETAGLRDWGSFAASWDDLGIDTYMADGGRYRRRRFAAFRVAAEGIVRKPHQPHYQSRDYNTLNGGIARWFAPIDETIGTGATMSTILACSRAVFESLCGRRDWHVEVHQFRIAARPGEEGRPTP